MAVPPPERRARCHADALREGDAVALPMAFVLFAALCLIATWAVGAWDVRRSALPASAGLVAQIQQLRERSASARRMGGIATTVCGAGIGGSLASGGASATTTAITALAALAVLAIGAPLTTRAYRREVARLRGVPFPPRGWWRVALVQWGSVALVAGAATLGWLLHREPGPARYLVVAAFVLAAQVVLSCFGGVVLTLAVGREPMPDEVRTRIEQMAQAMGVATPRLAVVPHRGGRIANAYATGVVPGLRWLVITRYLLDTMSPDEVSAVVGHELGHLRRHHVARRLGAQYAIAGVLIALASLVWGQVPVVFQTGTVVAALAVAGIPVRRRVNLGQELEADADAAAQVGGPALADALTQLGRVNDIPENTGDAWAKRVGHPGLADRISRLRRPDAVRVDATPLPTTLPAAGRHR